MNTEEIDALRLGRASEDSTQLPNKVITRFDVDGLWGPTRCALVLRQNGWYFTGDNIPPDVGGPYPAPKDALAGLKTFERGRNRDGIG